MEQCGCCSRYFDRKEMVKSETNSELYCRFCKALLEPAKIYCRMQVLSKPCSVPQERGLYAWYFKEIPGITPTDGCVVKDDLTLLYIGRSPRNDKSKGNLRKRMKRHFKGNASDSTLIKTLGILLACPCESSLNDWVEENAFVCWVTHPEPWKVEADIINHVSPPLNIQKNKGNSFSRELSEMRRGNT